MLAPKSSDLETVEKNFHILNSKVYSDNKEFKNKNESWLELTKQWENLGPKNFRNLYDSMTIKLIEVIETKKDN